MACLSVDVLDLAEARGCPACVLLRTSLKLEMMEDPASVIPRCLGSTVASLVSVMWEDG